MTETNVFEIATHRFIVEFNKSNTTTTKSLEHALNFFHESPFVCILILLFWSRKLNKSRQPREHRKATTIFFFQLKQILLYKEKTRGHLLRAYSNKGLFITVLNLFRPTKIILRKTERERERERNYCFSSHLTNTTQHNTVASNLFLSLSLSPLFSASLCSRRKERIFCHRFDLS